MNLAFLSPALLAGLVVVGVPILIHLISKRRARRVRFALIELLLKSQRRTARSIRLQQLLLLLLRTLLVAALAAALARPFLQDDARARVVVAPLVVVVVLDGSASMNAVASGKTVFERARRAALDAIRGEPADVRTAAVACGNDTSADPVELTAPTFERGRVVSAVEQSRLGVLSSSLPACVERATAMARSVAGDGERRVLVFSDLAAHGFIGGKAAQEGEGVVVEWRAMGDEAVANHAVHSAAAERISTRAGSALSVPFNAAQYGASGDVEADLLVDDTRAARLTLPLSDGRAVDRRFHVPMDGKWAQRAPTTLTVSLPSDALPLDDVVQLPVDAAGPLEVLLVDGAPQALAFQDEVFYLDNALEAVRGGRARLRTTTVSADQLTRAQIAGARVVVLANVAHLDDDTATALVEHVTAGAGLFITMGDQVDAEWMNNKLGAVLSAPLRGSKGQALLDDASVAEVLSLTRFQADHPLFGSLALSGGDNADLPGLARVRTQTIMLVEPNAETGANVLARFSNGAPALAERSVGAGRVLTLLTSVDRDWSDLAIRPGFVPLMQQAVLYLGGALDDDGPRAIHAGQPRVLQVPTGAVELVVEPPSGIATTLPVAEQARSVTFSGTTELGLYRVSSRGDGGELRERPGERFTVLLDPRESDLRPAPADMLAAAVPRGARARSGADDDTSIKLWPTLLLLAAALLVAEAALLKKTVM